MIGSRMFRVVRGLAECGMRFAHPCFRVIGRENIPQGGYIFCANHSSNSDGPWIAVALRQKEMPRIMVKDQMFKVPVLKHLFRWLGFIGVRRGEGDITAIKSAIKSIKAGEQLLIFPQGTRVPHGQTLPAKTGAALLATRTNSLVLPIYMQTKRRFWSKLYCVIGEPYRMEFEGARATGDDLDRLTVELMDTIYGLEKRI